MEFETKMAEADSAAIDSKERSERQNVAAA
jgi:hypothetical protein